MTTRAAKYAVHSPQDQPAGDESAVLALADDYRRQLAALHQERHDATVQIRDDWFPAMWEAMTAREHWRAVIYDLEREIKAHHSDVRDRNAVLDEQREQLAAARKQVAAAKRLYTAASAPWKLMFRAHNAYWHTLADWKNVKSRDARRKLYAAIVWPSDAAPYLAALDGENAKREAAGKPAVPYDPADLRPAAIAAYGAVDLDLDLRERALDEEFSASLHSAIRAEIKEATQPKLGKDSPGVRYRFGKTPEIRGWEKLSTHFPGGLTVADALSGKSRQLRLLATDDPTLYDVRQQIGTAAEPRMLEYTIRVHAPLPGDAVIKRWSHVTRLRVTPGGRKCYRRHVVPILDGLPDKPAGDTDVLHYRLRWTRRKEGVEVAHFWSGQVNERLIIPNRVLDRIAAEDELQAALDARANDMLAAYGRRPQANQRQGVEALAVFVAANAAEERAVELLDDCQRKLALAANDSRRARGCIEEIYKVAAARLARLHRSVAHDDIDLAKLKRYDSRDLLQEDRVPLKSRTILHAVSPGKLRMWLKQSGMIAIGGVMPQPPEDARETDVVTSYVDGLGRKTGTLPAKNGTARESTRKPLADKMLRGGP